MKDQFIGGMETAEERIKIVRRLNIEELGEIMKRPNLQPSVIQAAERRMRKLLFIEAKRL